MMFGETIIAEVCELYRNTMAEGSNDQLICLILLILSKLVIIAQTQNVVIMSNTE